MMSEGLLSIQNIPEKENLWKKPEARKYTTGCMSNLKKFILPAKRSVMGYVKR